MDNDAPRGQQDQLEEHSLPGTNQAGTGPGSSEDDPGDASTEGTPQRQEDLDAHSLPGTNQAGTGPGASETDDRTDA